MATGFLVLCVLASLLVPGRAAQQQSARAPEPALAPVEAA